MIGKIIGGRYQIINHLGGGGFSSTFVALDMHLPDEPQCVVKQLKPKSREQSILQVARRLFHQEAEVLYKLGIHDQIPQLFAHFEEDHEFYLVQEFVKGHELSQELASGHKLTEAQVIILLQDILEILVFVHQQSVIHRDIKASNLIRRTQDSKLVLIDFGAVKRISVNVINSRAQIVNSPGETRSLTIPIGTPGYMPYEQLAGRPRFCSDIYAVGILGIQALTGKHPKQLPEELSTGEIIWHEFAQVSTEFREILDKMVRFDFSQRYQSAPQVLEALSFLRAKTSTQNIKIPISNPEPDINSLTIKSIVIQDLYHRQEVEETLLPESQKTVTWKQTQPINKLAIFSKYRWQKLLVARKHSLQVLAASVAVTTIVIGARYAGILQAWELQTYDQLLQMRPSEPPDSRLLVVGVTEKDFQLPEQQQRKGSLSDQALALLLQKLEPYQPRAIGLDIYRDFPSKQENLATYLQHSNFFAVCKASDNEVNNPGILPPPEVSPERQGFSDVVKDRDAIVRRHLIAMEPNSKSPCKTFYALSAQLAFHYLQEEGIAAKFNQESNLQLGKVIFKRLRSHMGGYQKVDDWGYQILLNYRSSLKSVPTVTLAEVLQGNLKPEQVKGRIVLIGVTAQSAHDYALTPYSATQEFSQETPGVILQALMTSQILSAVKDGRPLLWVWPLWGEVLWVWIWSLVGGVLAWRCRSLRLLALTGVAALGLLYGLCFGFITQGGWLPLVPPALALVVTASSRIAFTVSQRSRSL